MAVEKGKKIKVDYVGTFEDGTEFDSSEKHGQPLEFEAGAGQVVKGFDEAVLGMEKGEEKEVTLKPADAYGDVNPQLVQKVPKETLKGVEELKAGQVIGIGTPDGRQFPARVIEISDKEVSLDLNHPLAGKTLKFKIKVVDC